jgi:NADH-quinone oxidoreductase subunit M
MMYLTLLWTLPAAFGLLALCSKEHGRKTSIVASFAVLAYALWLWVPYSSGTGIFRLAEASAPGALGIRYSLGVDGVSLLLCWLNAFLVVVAVVSSPAALPSYYFACFLFLEAAVMGVFLLRDLFYFYIFWELALIPMFFIIGIWGSENRVKAAVKFIVYTVFGSLFLLIGILAVVTLHHRATGVWTWSMAELGGAEVGAAAPWIFLAMALGFAVKVPVWPLHNWLPDAHTEAPAAGSVMLAGIMLKMGVYGFLRIVMPILPRFSHEIAPWIVALGVWNVLYGALCAMAQTDLKRMVAYSSISHLGLCMIGLFSWNAQGVAGASLQMINHGLSTGALFLMVGMMYDRTHRRGIMEYGGLADRMPLFAFFFGFVAMSSIGLPGLNGFVSEALSLLGAVRSYPKISAAAFLGAVLGAAYLLPAFQNVFWKPEGAGSVSPKMTSLTGKERGLLWTFAALILAMGLYPMPVLSILQPSVDALLK